jgi:hypothetical protein
MVGTNHNCALGELNFISESTTIKGDMTWMDGHLFVTSIDGVNG